MKTILFRADQDILKNIMTEAAGGFTQYVAWEQARTESQSEFVFVFKREKVSERVKKLV